MNVVVPWRNTHQTSAASSAADGKGGLRRGQVVHCREREWEGYGYGLLWLFVQDTPDREANDRRTGDDNRSPTARRSGGVGGVGGSNIGSGGDGSSGGKGRVSAELTSLATEYLVSLLKEPEVAQELWPLITRCMDNIAARRSVPSSLEVLRRAIATLPAHEAKNWFGGSRTKENRSGQNLEFFY